jgi:hypothetical protein
MKPEYGYSSGISVYDEAVVKYHREGGHDLKIKFKKPVVLGVADKPEKWGHFQFPSFIEVADGELLATWNMTDDAVSSYGTENSSRYTVSRDGGKTWKGTDSVFKGSTYGVLLNNGDYLKIYTPKARNVSELNLPSPISINDYSYKARYSFYRVNELPEVLQGTYLERLRKGETSWRVEHAAITDSNMVRYSVGDLFPVVWWGDMHIAKDGSVIAGVYPALYENENGKVDPGGVAFYRSTDNGISWKIQGRIPYQGDIAIDTNANKRVAFGFTEPGFEILSDGSMICVSRTSDGFGYSPMYISRSADMGKTWSRPVPFTRAGVLPRVLQLENGVVVLSAGRPGVQLRFSTDGKGEKWTDPFEMLPYDVENKRDAVSCGYTDLVATGPNSFLIIYSDFKFINDKGEIRKAIKVREVVVDK